MGGGEEGVETLVLKGLLNCFCVKLLFSHTPQPTTISRGCTLLLLFFSVTPFKMDQGKNQNRSIDKAQNLGNERRYIYKDPRQDSGQWNISYTRYPKKFFTQTYRDLYGNAMHADAHLDELQHGGQKLTVSSVTEFCYKSVNLFFEKLKH